jgi:hypothetical protein
MFTENMISVFLIRQEAFENSRLGKNFLYFLFAGKLQSYSWAFKSLWIVRGGNGVL